MENRNNCKICDKSFSSGKALGGHMRSHMAMLRVPQKLEVGNHVPKEMNSISETLQEEVAAETLIMISKDTWPEIKEIKIPRNSRDDGLVQTLSRVNFKCTLCSRVFNSSQALGGHKSSHNKRKNLMQEGGDSEENGYKKVHYRVTNGKSNFDKIGGEFATDQNFLTSSEDEEASPIEILTSSSED
ncbi:hypothetical protein RIF29_32986 [Crotalaria pallida]|uniref:C2H2-type domain-containing protein n=1 Tax=Crotalaria pallida TaxID=3830 RepID=A0AAN9HSQ8_CROPI